MGNVADILFLGQEHFEQPVRYLWQLQMYGNSEMMKNYVENKDRGIIILIHLLYWQSFPHLKFCPNQ